MMDDFRKKTFRGAKIEDLIRDLEALTKESEEAIKKTEDVGRQRFFEGMAIAYTTISLKLKGAFDYMGPGLADEFYKAAVRMDIKKELARQVQSMDHVRQCSFCGKEESEAGPLAPGPGVAICGSCLEFGKQVLAAGQQHDDSGN
jgi:hypothetical protein